MPTLAEKIAQQSLERLNEAEQTWSTLGVPGGGDSKPTGANVETAFRRKRFASREATLAAAKAALATGAMPALLERQIGPSLDWSLQPPDQAARLAGRAVARIVQKPQNGMEPVGIATGFIVYTGLLLTNYHVFGERDEPRYAQANFLYERWDKGIRTGVFIDFAPDVFFLANKELDFALIALDANADKDGILPTLGVLQPNSAVGKILVGDPINIIQHPRGEPKHYAFTDNRLLGLADNGALTYQTDTMPGSSGSPLLSKNWELVGLHRSAVPKRNAEGLILNKDGNPWDKDNETDEDVKWLGNEGVRISAIINFVSKKTFDNPDHQRRLEEFMETTSDPLDLFTAAQPTLRPAESARSIAPPDPLATGGTVVQQIVVNGPATFNFYAGSEVAAVAPAVAVPSAPAVAPGTAVEKSLRFDDDYARRPGFDPSFLGEDFQVPLPTVSAGRVGELFSENGAPVILKYHHYSLAFNRTRRMLHWAAGNVDYRNKKRDNRPRKEFGGENWRRDPRLPVGLQLEDDDFYRPATRVDRGHIVRREDNCWGDSPLLIEFGNSDSYHWTNCTPQHEAFNQSSGGASGKTIGERGVWGEFENYVQSELAKGTLRASILAGPVLAADDPSVDYGQGPIQCPISFWKVVLVVEEGALRAYGFVFSQAEVVARLGLEKELFDDPKFLKFRTPLARITELTGVIFDSVILAAEADR
jgi:endonuclease G